MSPAIVKTLVAFYLTAYRRSAAATSRWVAPAAAPAGGEGGWRRLAAFPSEPRRAATRHRRAEAPRRRAPAAESMRAADPVWRPETPNERWGRRYRQDAVAAPPLFISRAFTNVTSRFSFYRKNENL